MRCRGGFGGFGGPRAACVRQFRSGTIGGAAERLQGCQTAAYISRPDALPRSDAERLERSVGPGRGVSGSFGAVQYRGAAAERLQGWQAAAYIKARRAAARSYNRGVCRDGKLQPIYQGQTRCRGEFGGFGGPRAGCVRQFRSGTI